MSIVSPEFSPEFSSGNRTQTLAKTYTIDPDADRVSDDGLFTYTYTNEGNVWTKTRRADNPTGDYLTEYTFDHRNRLTKILVKDYVNGVLKVVRKVNYSYDAFDRLVGRNYDPDGWGPAGAQIAKYVYDGEHIALAINNYGQVKNRYLWADQVDLVLADEQVTNPGTIGNVLWPVADDLGTVRELAQHDGVNTTTAVNRRTYDSFGRLTSETSAAVDHVFGYTGAYWDESFGIQNHHHRWYDPALGRWLSEDPIGFASGDTNLYRYVGNGPVNGVDRNGLEIGCREAIEGTWTMRQLKEGVAEVKRNPWNAINPLSTGNILHLTAVAAIGSQLELTPTAVSSSFDEARGKLAERSENDPNGLVRGAATAGYYVSYAGEFSSHFGNNLAIGGMAAPVAMSGPARQVLALRGVQPGLVWGSRAAVAGHTVSNLSQGRFEAGDFAALGALSLVPARAPANAGRLGTLAYEGNTTWRSAGGLRYGADPRFGNRVQHVLRHAADDAARAGSHGVFDAGRTGTLGAIDEAFGIAQRGGAGVTVAQQGSRTVYTIDMGRRIGYVGGQAGRAAGNPAARHIQLVVENGNEVITAFPIIP